MNQKNTHIKQKKVYKKRLNKSLLSLTLSNSSFLGFFKPLRISLFGSLFSLILMLLLSLILVFKPQNALANSCDLSGMGLIKTGYTLNDKQKKILMDNLWNKEVNQKSDEDIIEIIEGFISKINPEIEINLAEVIFKAALATGLDPFVLTSVIKKESTFFPNAIGAGGAALGLTQMTPIAFTELRNQLGLDSKFQGSSVEEFRKLVSNFFDGDEDKITRYLNWMSETKNPNKRKVVLKNVEYSALTGALLLKHYLALRNGNYNLALQQYNGEASKRQYANQILKSQGQLIKSQYACESSTFSLDILTEICAFTNERSYCPKKKLPGNPQEI